MEEFRIDPELIAAFWERGQGAGAVPVDRLAPGRDHEAYFRRELASLGLEFDAEMATVFERFEVVYTEEVQES